MQIATRIVSLIILCLLGLTPISAQTSKKKADNFYKDKQYQKAYDEYLQVKNIQKDKVSLAKKGICSYHINKLTEASKDLTTAYKMGNSAPDLKFYMGRINHSMRKYEDAIFFYKSYLKELKSSEEIRPNVALYIKNCFSGMRLSYDDEDLGLVENAGNLVNSKDDEINPVPSPTVVNRYYYSSNRAQDNYDLYSAEMMEGNWQQGNHIHKSLNTPNNEILQDCSLDGSVMVFLRGERNGSNRLYLNRYSQSRHNQRVIFSETKAVSGDQDVYLVNDEIMIFASNREGGFGGYDLYISEFSAKGWSDPKNLGNEVNSSYDERYPFMFEDQSLLYFSSDNPNSIGGFDIFSSTKIGDEWSEPKAYDYPINSPEDDIQFRIQEEGFQAFLSSNRKSSTLGGFDIYTVFLRQGTPVHISDPKQPLGLIRSSVKDEDYAYEEEEPGAENRESREDSNVMEEVGSEEREAGEETMRLETERLEKEKLETEKLEAEKLETERLEKERLEAEKLEKERLKKEALEKERLETERLENERLENERLENERLEAERLEAERLEAERLEAKRLEAERLEKEKLEAEKLEAEKLETERLENERLEAERLEAERLETERLEKERLEAERLEAERIEVERLEKERLRKERIEKERLEANRKEKERLKKERLEAERLEAESLEAERLEAERLETERLEKERLEAERLEAERIEVERLEKERLRKERIEKERFETNRKEKERLKKERLEAERLEAESLEAARIEAARLEAERLEAERLEREAAELVEEPVATKVAEKEDVVEVEKQEEPVKEVKPRKGRKRDKEEEGKEEKDITGVILQPIIYDNDSELLNDGNKEILDKVITKLKNSGQANIILTSHSLPEGLPEFELMFAIRRAEKIAAYIIDNGVSSDRIILNAVGSAYPFVKKVVDDDIYESNKLYNNRVDIKLVNISGNSIVSQPTIDEKLLSPKYQLYQTVTEDVYFRVFIHETEKKMYKNAILRYYNDLLIENDIQSGLYKYYVGLYTDFKNAFELKRELENRNVSEAIIVAYYNGNILSLKDAKLLKGKYPELANYIEINQ